MRVLVATIIALATAAPAGAVTLPFHPHRHIQRAAVQAPAQAVADVGQELLAAVNGARAAHGLAALAIDPALEAAARGHAENLLAHDAFTHDFVDAAGSTPFAGWIGRYYRGGCAGENLATASPSLTADRAVRLWLASPGHRANLLSTRFTSIGVALQGSNGTWIAATDFGGC